MRSLLREDYERAIDELTLAVELQPRYPDINNALGIAHYFGGSKEMAIEYFKRACEINPNYIEARLHLAFTLIECGDIGEGVSLLEEIPHLDEEREGRCESRSVMMCEMHTQLGQMYEKTGELLDAMNEYKKALRLQPDFLDIALKLARTYSKLELFEEAHREFHRILQVNMEYHEARLELGMLFMREGKYEDARKQWERCLKSEAHEARARFYLKRLLRGDFKEVKGRDFLKSGRD